MSKHLKRLDEDEPHTTSCHERWSRRLNRDMTNPMYQENWYAEQCGGCAFYIRLQGSLAEDYGACSNPESAFDKTVMFEHDGCVAFAEAEEGW